MPGCQDDLVNALAALGKPLVNVVLGGGAVTTNNSAPAQLMAFYPGQAGGQGVADIVFGRSSPAGRLPYTVYRSSAQLPPFISYDMRNGTGFTYRFSQVQPQYTFGDGLSYANFSYAARVVEAPTSPCGTLTIAVDVVLTDNTGWQDTAEEVVQVYAAFTISSHAGIADDHTAPPAPSLQGFARVALAAGSSPKRTLTFELTPWQRSTVLADGTRVVGPGTLHLTAGGGQLASQLMGHSVQQLEVPIPGHDATPVGSCGDVRMRGAVTVA